MKTSLHDTIVHFRHAQVNLRSELSDPKDIMQRHSGIHEKDFKQQRACLGVYKFRCLERFR